MLIDSPVLHERIATICSPVIRQWKILQILEALRNGCTVLQRMAKTEVSDTIVRVDISVLQIVLDITERNFSGGIKLRQMKPLAKQRDFNDPELLSIHMSQQFLEFLEENLF